jgi:hypothetical protein
VRASAASGQPSCFPSAFSASFPVAERALALISIAHADFREGLEREAYEKRLIPRGFSF